MSAQVSFAHPPAPSVRAAPHPSLRDTFPSRGRLWYASKFYVNITWVSQILANITRGYAFEDVRFRGHVAQVRQKVLSDFSKKILLGFSFRGTPGEGPSLSVSLRDTEIHSSCALRTQREFSRSAERDQRLCLWNPQAFEKARSKLWFLGRFGIFADITRAFPSRGRGTA